MEQYSLRSQRSYPVILISIILHMLIIMLIFRQSIQQWGKDQVILVKTDQDDENIYLAQQLLSAGQQQPATVLFQDEAPSGQTMTPSDIAQEEQLEEPEPEQEPEQATEKKEPEQQRKEESPEGQTTFETVIEEKKVIQKPKRKRTKRKKTVNKQQLTLADISRGFIKSMQQEAGYNDPATQNMRQLALQVYTSKVWNLIKNAFLAGESSLHLPRPVSAHTQLVLTIDRSGKLLDIQLIYQRHLTELRNIERLIISRAKQAGLFPPLPTQIKGESKTFSFPIFIQGEQGFHSYALSYR